MKSIFTYTDYRICIKDAITSKQSVNPLFSLRSAALHMGISSGSLTRILNSSRNAGPALCTKFITFLGLRKREAEYFKLLVKFESLKEVHQRRACYQQILHLRAERRTPVPQEHHRFFTQWFHIALFELLKIHPEPPDYEKLGALLRPQVSAARIRKASVLLEKLGYIQFASDGTVITLQPFLSTGDTWQSTAIHDFQVTMAELGAKALNTIPKPERDFSTLTVALCGDAVEKIRAIIKEARTEISSVEEKCTSPDRVYQINFQCFPLSTHSKNETSS